MIYIFHGQDSGRSRAKLNQFLDSKTTSNTLRLDHKSATLDNVNLFLNSVSFFADKKLLLIDNFFSLAKPTLEKIVPILLTSQEEIVLWQDKQLTATQLKTFPTAKVEDFRAADILWATINSLLPGNAKAFAQNYDKMLQTEPYDLFLYLVKNSFRKQLATFSKFDKEKLKKTYLLLIELDYQNKTGTLAIPKELALERVLISLLG